jgi:hypothetical protein
MPLKRDAGSVEQSICPGPPPKRPVVSAIIANVGVAVSVSQREAPEWISVMSFPPHRRADVTVLREGGVAASR